MTKKKSKSSEGNRIQLSSVMDLTSFLRVASTDTLIHKSTRDLWQITADGQFIDKLFDDSGDPLQC